MRIHEFHFRDDAAKLDRLIQVELRGEGMVRDNG
jgi:hypothetical protein